jgi:hypothetical protein
MAAFQWGVERASCRLHSSPAVDKNEKRTVSSVYVFDFQIPTCRHVRGGAGDKDGACWAIDNPGTGAKEDPVGVEQWRRQSLASQSRQIRPEQSWPQETAARDQQHG